MTIMISKLVTNKAMVMTAPLIRLLTQTLDMSHNHNHGDDDHHHGDYDVNDDDNDDGELDEDGEFDDNVDEYNLRLGHIPFLHQLLVRVNNKSHDHLRKSYF